VTRPHKWKCYLGLHDYVQDQPDRPRGGPPPRTQTCCGKNAIQTPLCEVRPGSEAPDGKPRAWTGTAGGQVRRRSVAHRVSWWRVESWSFRSTEETWLSTVLPEM